MQQLSLLLPRWVAEATEPLPSESSEAVRRVFEQLGSIATADVLSLYRALGGMRMMDDEYWRLWSLDEVAGQDPPKDSGVLFSDYCMSCWSYRLKPVSPSHSAVYVDHFDGSPPKLVAATLTDFFDRYVTSARALLDEASLKPKHDA